MLNRYIQTMLNRYTYKQYLTVQLPEPEAPCTRPGLWPVALIPFLFLRYDLLIEGQARQWVACSEGHSPESRRTCRVDT
jgi:hypothetical protein